MKTEFEMIDIVFYPLAAVVLALAFCAALIALPFVILYTKIKR